MELNERKKMDAQEILEAHAKWANDEGGKQLVWSDLTERTL
jgi:hypothetical protein